MKIINEKKKKTQKNPRQTNKQRKLATEINYYY